MEDWQAIKDLYWGRVPDTPPSFWDFDLYVGKVGIYGIVFAFVIARHAMLKMLEQFFLRRIYRVHHRIDISHAILMVLPCDASNGILSPFLTI
jgi:hypothetical protein